MSRSMKFALTQGVWMKAEFHIKGMQQTLIKKIQDLGYNAIVADESQNEATV
jgi:hypothetical protein